MSQDPTRPSENPRGEDYTVSGTFRVGEARPLPEILDVLVVGGGPAGTAAAFHATELGLSVLVVDYDDILKRIRDYQKEKLIDPAFGGGDRARFPDGGELIRKLHFQKIDKDDMVEEWKSFYRDGQVSARCGIELTGLGERIEGVWTVKTYNHNVQREETYRARHVILAIGRGVPRRFDIPGDPSGIAMRLDDASRYLGKPVLVIGGGISAAEAVIAISTAKQEAGDESMVYWSYRGTRMPKLSIDLAGQFFSAFVHNGNIVYLRQSEPVIVCEGPDHCEYLSIRVDRREMPGRPAETVHLEFEKTSVIACIGEDIPRKLLATLGIEMGRDEQGKEKMLVRPTLESQQEGLYLVGDILANSYWETDSFDAPPTDWKLVKHPGNIKSSLADGVHVIRAIQAKMEGREPPPRPDLSVARSVEQPASSSGAAEVSSEPEKAQAAPKPAPKPEPKPEPAPAPAPEKKAAPAPEPASPPPAKPPAEVTLYRVDRAGEHESFVRPGARVSIGRSDCDISLPGDDLVSPHHVTLEFEAERNAHFLRDEQSENGTFIRLTREIPLLPHTLFIAGRQRLHLDFSGETGGPALIQKNLYDEPVGVHPLPEGVTIAGRQAPLTLCLDDGSEDPALSRRHFALIRRGSEVTIRDLESVNGTLVYLSGRMQLEDGDQFRIGRTIFSFNRDPAEARDSRPVISTPARPAAPPAPTPAPSSPPPAPTAAPGAPEPALPETEKSEPEIAVPAAASAAPSSGPSTLPASGPPSVTFEGHGTFPVAEGQTLLEVAEAHDLPMDYSCRVGSCGADPVEILEGREHFNSMTEDEEETIETFCDVDDVSSCRLACLARITGPVRVRIQDNH